ncbi:MAG: DUF222 domain-containing protein [Acidimicrobiales bacterium]
MSFELPDAALAHGGFPKGEFSAGDRATGDLWEEWPGAPSYVSEVPERVAACGRWGLDSGDGGGGPVGLGQWLVESRAGMDRGEAEWLERLGEFDRGQFWALDGALSCCSWLMWKVGMARSTAFERLRVAHELFRRPIIAEAFRAGALSYSAVRIVTRMDHPTAEVDQAIVDLAATDGVSVADIERLVRSYELYASQDRAPIDRSAVERGVSIRRGDNGVGQLVVTLTDLEVEEFAACLQAFIDLRYRPSASAAPVDESPRGDSNDAGCDVEEPSMLEAPMEEAGRSARMADAFMDMVASALGAADGGGAAGDDRYLVHVVTSVDNPVVTLADGNPLPAIDGLIIGCDSSRVEHTVGAGGEPLSLGRRTRAWNTSQRRAIRVRDGGRCRFPGCAHRFVDIHHLLAWERDGATDVANGCLQCRRHHRMLHGGYRVEGDPNGELRYYRTDGSYLGSTCPSPLRAAYSKLSL